MKVFIEESESSEFKCQGKNLHNYRRRLHQEPSVEKMCVCETTKSLLIEKNIEDRKRLIDERLTLGNVRGKKQRTRILFTDESSMELFPKPNRQNMRMRTSDPKMT